MYRAPFFYYQLKHKRQKSVRHSKKTIKQLFIHHTLHFTYASFTYMVNVNEYNTEKKGFQLYACFIYNKCVYKIIQYLHFFSALGVEGKCLFLFEYGKPSYTIRAQIYWSNNIPFGYINVKCS